MNLNKLLRRIVLGEIADSERIVYMAGWLGRLLRQWRWLTEFPKIILRAA
jgi:hypothetical protein